MCSWFLKPVRDCRETQEVARFAHLCRAGGPRLASLRDALSGAGSAGPDFLAGSAGPSGTATGPVNPLRSLRSLRGVTGPSGAVQRGAQANQGRPWLAFGQPGPPWDGQPRQRGEVREMAKKSKTGRGEVLCSMCSGRYPRRMMHRTAFARDRGDHVELVVGTMCVFCREELQTDGWEAE